MAKDKRSFILYSDIRFTVQKLTDEKAGKLFKHILAYVNDENPETDDVIIEIAFEPIKQSLKRDLRKWEGKIKQCSDAGKASAEARKNIQRPLTTVDESKKRSTDSTVSVNVNDNVKEELKTKFELFRLNYPGTKRGFKSEFENFCKKHSDWREITPILFEKLKYQVQARDRKKKAGGFVPEWKNLQTWINQRCWEEIINTEIAEPRTVVQVIGPDTI